MSSEIKININRKVRFIVHYTIFLISIDYFKNQHVICKGLLVPFARVGSGDPVRVLRLFHNKYTGFN